ncbi:MAG: iron-containing alcohol dehydrogenase [Acidimicrobiales bacterium]|nr:iron-containing alcohol dehydrogenase [Acidimicrobiales bacterium]
MGVPTVVVDAATVQEASLAEVLAEHAGASCYTSAAAKAEGLAPAGATVTDSLEAIAVDALVEAERHRDSTTVLGIGGGLTVDTAKYVGLRTGKEVVVVPTALSCLAPFTTEVARRVRRQISWVGDISPRVVLDLALLGRAPVAHNRAGAAELVSSLSAMWDWRLADARDTGLPVVARLANLVEDLRRRLDDASGEVRAASPEGLRALAGLLTEAGASITDAGHRRHLDGSEHTFAQAFEHRLGRLNAYGGMVGMGTVAMTALQAWFGLSAGGPVDPQDAVDLLTRCGVGANPHQLGVDEGTFRGVLRHTVRFAVGEFLPYSVLNEADVNFSAAEEMWRWCWRVPAST